MPKLTPITASILAIGVLAVSYCVYALESKRVNAALGETLPLSESLDTIPLSFPGWDGKDTPLDEAVIKVAAADEHINRWYWNDRQGEGLHLYVCYYGHPRTHVGHYPEICYPSAGWKQQMAARDNLQVEDLTIPADIHHFQRDGSTVTVVSFFVVGGQYTNDKEVAKRAAHRSIDKENRNYLAQVQISISGELPVTHVTDLISRFLSHLLPHLNNCLPQGA